MVIKTKFLFHLKKKLASHVAQIIWPISLIFFGLRILVELSLKFSESEITEPQTN